VDKVGYNFLMSLFAVQGTVQRGDGKGARFGFPTANITCDESLPSGIFAGEVIWNGVSYPAALYRKEGSVLLEAHLLDFSKNLYKEKITVVAHQKIRDVKKFSNESELVAAIAQDVVNIRTLSS